jgi:hypothetical protein
MERLLLLWSTEVYPLSSGWNIPKFRSGVRYVGSKSSRQYKMPYGYFHSNKNNGENEFVVVTDGLVGEFDMSFGWKICTLNGENIAEHGGPAFRQASSF